MTKEEYTTLINNIVKNPDQSAVTAKDLLKGIEEDLAQIDTLKQANTDYEKKVRNLQDVNMQLFLAQTNQAPKQEEEKEVTLEDFASKLVSKEREEI